MVAVALPLESRLGFLHRLDEAAAGRAVAWVFDHSALRAEAIGRCWSQGRLLARLADS